jgi:PrgI family protein
MTRPARIPADVNRPDRVLGPFTARQSVLLLTTAAVGYGAWIGLRPWVPLPIFLAIALPVAATAVAVTLGQRDGLPLDRFLLAVLRHHLNPRRTRATSPTGAGNSGQLAGNGTEFAPDSRLRTKRTAAAWRPAPAALLAHAHTASLVPDPTGPGVLDLGGDGLVAIAAMSTLNLGLHTPAEQDALVAGFARYLHTLTGPVQFLIRTVPVSLDGHLSALDEQARALPHPALVTAALGHRAHLAQLAAPTTAAGDGDGDSGGLTARQVLLVMPEATAGMGGQHQLLHRLEDATTIFATLDIAVTPLDAAQIRSLLLDCCNPDHDTAGRPHTTSARSAAPPIPPPRSPARTDPGNQRPRVPHDFTAIDVALQNGGRDERHEGHGPYAEHAAWFDNPSLPDRLPDSLPDQHPSYRGSALDVDGPTGEFDLDELDPGATEARWWGP